MPLWERYKNFIHKVEAQHPLFNAILITGAVILVWRGAWILFDTYFFPTQPVISAVVSIAIGVLILFLDDFKLTELWSDEQ